MSKGQTLRALVKERLAAAAEDIFVLFERTIAEYEEELCRSKEENLRKQQILETLLGRQNMKITSPSPGPGLNQEVKTPCVQKKTEEECVKKEEQLPESVPESRSVCVKTEESSLLQQQGEEISSETQEQSQQHSPDTDHHHYWESADQMETEADDDLYNQVQSRDRSFKLFRPHRSAPQTSVHSAELSGAEEKKHQCPFCQKRFGAKQTLKTHIRVHTGEKPFGCPVCKKNFTQKSSLNLHIRIHTGEKPFCCSFCNKTFAQKCNLKTHMITHQGLTFPHQTGLGFTALTDGT